jgi:predicted nucleic acid-binding protein
VTEDAVLVDTDVFSLLFVDPRRPDGRRASWREALLGRSVVIAAQTRGEILAGARIAGWGVRRYADVIVQLDLVATLPVTYAVVDAYATLKADCRRQGHPLGGKPHDGDRWIAATSVAHDIPLLAGDHIYDDAPGIRLLTTSEG